MKIKSAWKRIERAYFFNHARSCSERVSLRKRKKGIKSFSG